ncbi:hypothetical protein D9M71_820030 [compost metagenome]
MNSSLSTVAAPIRLSNMLARLAREAFRDDATLACEPDDDVPNGQDVNTVRVPLSTNDCGRAVPSRCTNCLALLANWVPALAMAGSALTTPATVRPMPT